MYFRKEALLSSKIEGTQSTLEDLLEFEAGDMSRESAKEVLDHVRAMDYALNRLPTLPLSLKLIMKTHERLMTGAGGGDRNPGKLRSGQARVGGLYYPPPAERLPELLDDLQSFMIADDSYSDLVHCGIVHAQFETIHPFSDGNGRIGRLLITLQLCARGILGAPLLYLSHYLLENRAEYYARLMAIRDDGDWESWVSFFLNGVWEVSGSAARTAESISELRAGLREKLEERSDYSPRDLQALDLLFSKPVISITDLARKSGCSYPTARKVIDKFESLGIVVETTGMRKNTRFRFEPYVNLFK